MLNGKIRHRKTSPENMSPPSPLKRGFAVHELSRELSTCLVRGRAQSEDHCCSLMLFYDIMHGILRSLTD